MENPSYYTHTAQPTVDRQGTIPVYSVLSRIERQSVKQPEYADVNKPKKQMVSPKGPPCQTENINESLNQWCQELYLSEEGSHIYDQPVLSKKVLPPQAVNETDNMDSSPNGESQKLYPFKEGSHIYDQPVLSKKELPPQMVNGTDNKDSSPNGESQELSPSEVVRPV